ncbi:MAG: D-aminoacyl-tRNA deacylase [Candidatus Glassbacteria bacterium]
MRIVLQRVSEASVTVSGEEVSKIGRGLLLLVGVGRADSDVNMAWLAEKCVNLRIFPDEEDKMNKSLLDVGGEVLAISQFTLYGDTRKGRRPSFVDAAPPDEAKKLFNRFVEFVRDFGVGVKTGVFGAMMDVKLNNAGPVTIILER